MKLDDFTWAYIDAALWSSTGDDDEPLDANYGIHDLAPETLARFVADCKAFQDAHYDRIAVDLAGAGHDFWLTRNGHGAGFWDGDWPEHGDALTEACEAFGNCELYVADDNLIYC